METGGTIRVTLYYHTNTNKVDIFRSRALPIVTHQNLNPIPHFFGPGCPVHFIHKFHSYRKITVISWFHNGIKSFLHIGYPIGTLLCRFYIMR